MLDDTTIDRWLTRGQRFFRGINKNTFIAAALEARGWNEGERTKGWAMYSDVLGMSRPGPKPAATSNQAAEAMTELDNWDAPNFRATDAILSGEAPQANTFLFKQLQASEGPEAVVAVELFLKRREALKSGTAEDVATEQANRAVELLATRRIVDDEIAAKLSALVDKAKEGATTSPKVEVATLDEQTFERYRAWLHGWRELARSVFTRRDHLIMLGLASRRGGGDDGGDGPSGAGAAA